MEQVWKFEANDGWKFSLALERESHRLCLEAAKGGLVWKMFAEDMLDNTEDHPSSFCLEARDKGRYWLFHSGTQVVLEQDGWTLHTCPISCETLAPLPALMVHYRFRAEGGGDERNGQLLIARAVAVP